MENTVIEILRSSPLAVVLFWMVYIFNRKDDDKNEQIKSLHSRMMEVIENNTRAVTTVDTTVKENTKATETLTNRIYDLMQKK